MSALDLPTYKAIYCLYEVKQVFWGGAGPVDVPEIVNRIHYLCKLFLTIIRVRTLLEGQLV